MRVLVTGGAGFIGSHVVDALLEAGHAPLIVDVVDASAHGADPEWVPPEVPLLRLDGPTERGALLVVGDYGAGKSHLMATLSAVAERASAASGAQATEGGRRVLRRR